MKGWPTINALLLLLFLCLPWGCEETRDRPRQEGPVRVGLLFPLSGDLSDVGGANQQGALLAIEEINAQGGVLSLGGKDLVPILGDTRGQEETGERETRRLIVEERVVAIIGAYQSSVTRRATQVAEQHTIPFLVNMGVADVITERGYQYTFRICPKAQFYGRDQVLFLKELLPLTGYAVKRVGLLYENTDFGTITALAQKRALREHGLALSREVSYAASEEKDLEDEVRQVLESRPEALLTVTYLNDSILIRRALVALGARLPVIDAAGGVASPSYVEALGPAAEGMFTLSEYSKYYPGGRDVNHRFQNRFGRDLTGESAYAYQAVWVLKDALERCASLDPGLLRRALGRTDLPRGEHMILPAERLCFGPDGQNPYAQLFVLQIQDGQYLPVWPQEFATARPRWQTEGHR